MPAWPSFTYVFCYALSGMVWHKMSKAMMDHFQIICSVSSLDTLRPLRTLRS